MSNRVSLWVERISERSSFSKIFYHTSICVELKNEKKIVLSYSDNGLTYSTPGQEEDSKTEIHLGYTAKTLTEIVECAEDLVSTAFRQYDVIKRNCNYFCNELSMKLCGEGIPNKYLIQSQVAVGVGSGISGVMLGTAIIGAALAVLFRK